MNNRRTVNALLEQAGRTYADEAGITLADRPAPLYQLLVLAELMSTRISAHLAVGAARELVHAGYRTPQRVAAAGRQELVDALDRGRYVRYDESTATRLRANAALLLDRYHGDLRRLAAESGHDPVRCAELLQQFEGIGPVAADIFLREVQDIWTWLRPRFDERARRGARQLHLPTDPRALDELGPAGHDAELAAALVRVTIDHDLAPAVLGTG
ncbi:endonuclease [Nocardia sp. alder85J]|uniref:endonuclease n=1 Tax=Nocardia sp. alder85J TaxID=2862949 RepID=UPI001CD53CE8|nr:endonuclease [Nocardia sp. alder85J]MCX4098899.1 endonuclease [Nocardia sp. alder85J]